MMVEFLSEHRLWIKAIHVSVVMFWMAALFYLPRLFVYHAGAAPDSSVARTLAVMERRLMRAIMTPAMVAVWLTGLALIFLPGGPGWPLWLVAKGGLVLILTGFHGILVRWRSQFAVGENRHSVAFYRVVNEIPPVLAVVVIILAIVRPG